MSRLLWFLIGGITTFIGTGIAATMLGEDTEKGNTGSSDLEDNSELEQEAEPYAAPVELEE
ncbi:hypothetical protein LJC36_02465 [Desulfovibrio sp. OttesenSCG-928-C14]|nr:hypothetical protein [Desulfovibrio sp. OttesenSCG-928-C14]